jgi:PhoH-like ATPase
LKRNRAAFYRITGPIVGSLLINQFVFFGAGEPPLYAACRD